MPHRLKRSLTYRHITELAEPSVCTKKRLIVNILRMESKKLGVMGDKALIREWRTFFETSQRVKTQLDESLRSSMRCDLEEYNFFLVLAEAPQHTLRLAEIADRLVFSFARLNYRVGVMVDRGYITKRVCEYDRRSQEITMTEAGLRRYRELSYAHDEHLTRLFGDDITIDDLKELARLVSKFNL